VAVMQAAPGRIVEIVDVGFARPRQPALFSDQAFHHVCDRIAHLLDGGSADG
jgi:NitT/TauT family transport system ATP-binding protein